MRRAEPKGKKNSEHWEQPHRRGGRSRKEEVVTVPAEPATARQGTIGSL